MKYLLLLPALFLMGCDTNSDPGVDTSDSEIDCSISDTCLDEGAGGPAGRPDEDEDLKESGEQPTGNSTFLL